jgi:hypothetical protein
VLCLAFAQACTNASASSPIETPTAPNVSIAPGSLWIVHPTAEFILKLDGELYYETEGQPGKTVAADVFRQDGQWIAVNPIGTEPTLHVIVSPQTGTTNAYIDGRVLFLISGDAADGALSPYRN